MRLRVASFALQHDHQCKQITLGHYALQGGAIGTFAVRFVTLSVSLIQTNARIINFKFFYEISFPINHLAKLTKLWTALS
jgi:hypothetical protein